MFFLRLLFDESMLYDDITDDDHIGSHHEKCFYSKLSLPTVL